MRVTLVDLSTQFVNFLVCGIESFWGIEFDEFDFSGSNKSAGTGVDVVPEVLDRVGCQGSVWHRRGQQRIEQTFVFHIVLLMHPQCFEKMMSFSFMVRIKALHPLLSGCDDGFRITTA